MTDEIQGLTKDNTFCYDDYQVVRGEFLSQTGVPAICFDGVRVSVNTVCLRKLPNIKYIQFLVNPSERKLALRPCEEDDKDSFMWCNEKNGKRIPRKIVCSIFSAMLAELMGWSMEKRYRIMGAVVKTNSEHIILFDLNDYETLCHTARQSEAKAAARNSCFPEEWRDRFGLTAKEHERSIKVNLFDDYTVFRLNR